MPLKPIAAWSSDGASLLNHWDVRGLVRSLGGRMLGWA